MKKRKFENKGFAWVPLILTLIVGGITAWYWLSGRGIVGLAFDIFNVLFRIIIPAVSLLFKELGKVAANLINVFAVMNPFSKATFAPIVWEICKNLAYLALIFLGLVAGFMYIIGKDPDANRILLYCIVAAFLINFTFLLAKEIFYVSWVLVRSFASYFSPQECIEVSEGNYYCDIGTAIYTSLSTIVADADKIKSLREGALHQLGLSINEGDISNIGNVQAAILLGTNLGIVILQITAFIILMGFAFITLVRFLIISFLVGFLPLAVVALAIPGRAGYWQRWWKEFLKWCFNFPLLMLLTLVGFSLIAYGTGYFSESDKGLFFAAMQYSVLRGAGDVKDYATAMALILRFVFICGYYVLIMYLCISLGDAFGKLGVNAGQWIWLKIGGGVRWGAKTAWRPAAERIGKRFESAAETFSRYASIPVVGGMFGGLKRLAESVGEKMTKPSKEAKESEAQNIFKKYEKENKEDILLKEVLAGQHKRLENELTKILTDKLSKEEVMNAFKDLDETTLKGLEKRKKVFSILNKKLGGLLTKETAEEISAAVADLNLSEIDWVSLRKWFMAVDKGEKLEEAISILPELLSKERKKRFAVNPTAWPLIKANPDLLKDEDIVRGIQSNPAWRIYQKERDSGKNPEEISIDPRLLKGVDPNEARGLFEKILPSKPPEPLKKGERVRLKGTNEEGIITWLSHEKNEAVIRLRDGSEQEVSLDQLERLS
jgi:hypothetical protein